MNRTIKQGRANSFMVELLLTILFFSLAAGVLLRLFAATADLSRQSRERNQAVFLAQSTAELLREAKPAGQVLQEYYPEAEDIGRIPVDGRGEFSPDGGYTLAVTVSQENGERGVLERLDIRIYAKTECVYTLSTANYLSGEAGA